MQEKIPTLKVVIEFSKVVFQGLIIEIKNGKMEMFQILQRVEDFQVCVVFLFCFFFFVQNYSLIVFVYNDNLVMFFPPFFNAFFKGSSGVPPNATISIAYFFKELLSQDMTSLLMEKQTEDYVNKKLKAHEVLAVWETQRGGEDNSGVRAYAFSESDVQQATTLIKESVIRRCGSGTCRVFYFYVVMQN
jgi:hypothetical protein